MPLLWCFFPQLALTFALHSLLCHSPLCCCQHHCTAASRAAYWALDQHLRYPHTLGLCLNCQAELAVLAGKEVQVSIFQSKKKSHEQRARPEGQKALLPLTTAFTDEMPRRETDSICCHQVPSGEARDGKTCSLVGPWMSIPVCLLPTNILQRFIPKPLQLVPFLQHISTLLSPNSNSHSSSCASSVLQNYQILRCWEGCLCYCSKQSQPCSILIRAPGILNPRLAISRCF